MTFDRKYKKDSFFAYKAWLNPEPMVHLCGKRYIDRVEDVTKVTAYSTQPSVELFANGVSVGIQTKGSNPFFYFEVPNTAPETKLVAVAGELRDESVIRKVEVFNEDYRLKEKGAILNWFDIEAPEGYLNLNDKMSVIMDTLQGKMLLGGLFLKLMPKKKDGDKNQVTGGMELTGDMMAMLGGFTILRLLNMAGGMLGIEMTKEELLALNAKLNKIKRPKGK